MKTKIILLAIFVVIAGLVIENAWGQEKSTKSSELKAGTQVKTNLVCMVNDAYMGKEQIPVEYEGKTYYGCCQGCVTAIQTKRSVRYALDPATGKEVDKAKAYIVIKSDGSKKVLYFESETTYKQYQKQL